MVASDINTRIASNLNKYMELRNTTQLELAEYMGVSQTTVSNWCKGIKMPRMDKIDKICTYFGINRSNLMDDNPLEGVTNLIYPDGYAIPILGTICAGNGVWCEENFDGVFVIDRAVRADCCLRVRGDSMIDAGINDGDVVFIKKSYDYENGKIYAVRINTDTEAILKSVHKQDDKIILSPKNSAYSPLIEDISDVSIIGECVGVYHTL